MSNDPQVVAPEVRSETGWFRQQDGSVLLVIYEAGEPGKDKPLVEMLRLGISVKDWPLVVAAVGQQTMPEPMRVDVATWLHTGNNSPSSAVLEQAINGREMAKRFFQRSMVPLSAPPARSLMVDGRTLRLGEPGDPKLQRELADKMGISIEQADAGNGQTVVVKVTGVDEATWLHIGDSERARILAGEIPGVPLDQVLPERSTDALCEACVNDQRTGHGHPACGVTGCRCTRCVTVGVDVGLGDIAVPCDGLSGDEWLKRKGLCAVVQMRLDGLPPDKCGFDMNHEGRHSFDLASPATVQV